MEKLPSTAELKEDVKAASKSSLQSLRALLAGGVGGVFAVVVGHPFDLVKVRMQTAEKGVYTGAMDVVRKTIAKEGLARGLYAGVSAPLVGVTPMCEYLGGAVSTTSRLTFNSRCIILGLRSRQAARLQRFKGREQPVLRRTNLGRRLLQRHPHDHHHRTLRARKSASANPGTKEPSSWREA